MSDDLKGFNMGCSCEVEVCSDGDGPDVFNAIVITARKQHKCGECRRVIETGEKYENVKGLWEGGWQTYKTCSDCVSIRSQFFPHGYYYEMIMEDFEQFVIDSDGEIHGSCIAKLTPGARAVVCEMIERIWQEAENMGA